MAAVGYGVVNAGTYTTDKFVCGSDQATDGIVVNTDKFTVAADTGNTAIAGTLTVTGAIAIASTGSIAVNTNKFTVSGAGAVTIASTLTVTGVTTTTARIVANGGIMLPISAVLTSDTMVTCGGVIRVNPTGGAFNLTLPTPSASNTGMVFHIKNVTNSATAVTVKSTSSGTLDGVAAGTGIAIAKAYGGLTVVSDGTNWHVLYANIT